MTINVINNPILKSAISGVLLMVAGCTMAVANLVPNDPINKSVVKSVKNTVEQEKLVTNPECTDYLFSKNAQPGLDLVNVMEKHGGNCPGDPHIQHRLFSVYVDQKTGQMLSDKDDPEDGTLSLLIPKK